VVVAHPLGGRDPLRSHHARPAADATLAARVVQPALRIVSDGVDAELREHGDDAVERSAHRGGCVDHRFSKADDVDLAGVEVLQRLDEDALAAGEAVEAADFEGIPRLSMSEVLDTSVRSPQHSCASVDPT